MHWDSGVQWELYGLVGLQEGKVMVRTLVILTCDLWRQAFRILTCDLWRQAFRSLDVGEYQMFWQFAGDVGMGDRMGSGRLMGLVGDLLELNESLG